MKIILSLLLFIIIGNNAISATFTSSANGNWNVGTTWGGACASGCVEGVDYPGSTDEVYIYSSVTISASLTARALNVYFRNSSLDILNINANGNLILTSNGSINFWATGNRARLNVNGTITFNNNTVMTGNAIDQRFKIGTTGKYVHNSSDGGVIYTPTEWPEGSILEITGLDSEDAIAPEGLNQNFYHVVWNCPLQGTDIDLNGDLKTVYGDLNILSTGYEFYLIFSTATTYDLTVGGDITISGNTITYFSNGVAIANIICGGNFEYSAVSMDYSSFSGGSGNSTLSVEGNVIVDAPSLGFYLSQSTGTGTLQFKGNFNLTNNTTIRTSINRIGRIIFNGTTTQTFTSSGTLTGRIDYIIRTGSTVDLGINALSGTGAFTMESASKLILGSLDLAGAIQSGTTGGNIRVSGPRNFPDDATAEIIFRGTGAQALGTSYPDKQINLTIDNANGVAINGNYATIKANSVLNLINGSLKIGNNRLIIEGNIAVGAGFLNTNSSSKITINGSGDLAAALPFDATTTQIAVLTIFRSNSGNIPLGKNIEVTDSLNLNAGNLVINDRTLTIKGKLINGGGNLSGNTLTRLVINGSGPLSGEIPFAEEGNIIKTLQIERTSSGSVTLGSDLTLTDTLALFEGSLNTTTLTMGSNSLIRRRNGTISSSPNAASVYSVTYGNGINVTTGPELPSSANTLQNLTINRNTGTVSLAAAITVNGNVLISSGSLNTSTSNYAINVKGNWTNNGTFIPNTSTVTFNGSAIQTVSGSTSSTIFNALNINNSAGVVLGSTGKTYQINGLLSLSAGALSIGENVLDLRSTISSVGGSLTGGPTSEISLNGTGGGTLPTVTSGLRSLSINRSGQTVTLGGPVNVTGSVNLTSGTINSNSNLTVDLNSGYISPDGTGSISNPLNVKKTAATNRYHHIASPLAGATMAEINDDVPVYSAPANRNLFTYDETVSGPQNSGWVPVTSTTAPLDLMKGFNLYYFSPATIDITGTYNHAAEPSSALSYTDAGTVEENGWHSIGNPFPSPLNWNSVIRTNVDDAIYIWNSANNSYSSYVNGAGIGTTNVIPSFQAFWVKVSGGPSGNIAFPKSSRTTTSNPSLFREAANENVLRLSLSSGGFKDETILRFNSSASESFDGSFDAYKMTNSGNTPNLYSTIDKTKYSINTLPEINSSLMVPLTAKVAFDGMYTINASELGTFDETVTGIYLIDSLLNTKQNLLTNPEYSASITKADTSSSPRFYIGFEQGNITDVDTKLFERFYVSTAGNVLNLKLEGHSENPGTLIISNLQGVTVFEKDNVVLGKNIQEISTGLKTGLYLIKINTNNKSFVKKVYLSE